MTKIINQLILNFNYNKVFKNNNNIHNKFNYYKLKINNRILINITLKIIINFLIVLIKILFQN